MEILDFPLNLNDDFDTDTTLDRKTLSLLQNIRRTEINLRILPYSGRR